MLYLVIARDASDPEVFDRRERARPRHLEDLAPAVEEGSVRVAGALLNDAGQPIGSMILVEAQSEDDVRELLARDVYTRERVWRSFEIHPFKQAY